MMRRSRLIIADDHQMFAEGVREALEGEFRTVGMAKTGDELMCLLHRQSADCVLLDISLPGKSGLELLPELHRVNPNLAVLVVTMFADHAVASAAIGAGAQGFIPKDAGVEELRTAIREVLAGRRYLSPKVAPHPRHLGPSAVHVGFSGLTPRQQEVVLLVAKGVTSAEIAQQFGVSGATIAFHRQNIRKRLGITSESGLLRYAVLIAASLRNGTATLSADLSPCHAARATDHRGAK